MKSSTWDDALLADHRSYIRDESAVEAFDVLVDAAIKMPLYQTSPTWPGEEKRDFQYDDVGSDERPFAFIVNRGHLLFYVRSAGKKLVPGGFAALKAQLSTANENPHGEWTVRITSREDADRLNRFLFPKMLAANDRKSGKIARTFTQYWKNATVDWHEADELEHSASNQFRDRGVRPGDHIFIVTVSDGNMHLGGVLVVDKLVGRRAAQKRYGREVWDATDHVFARKSQPFYKTLVVPMAVVTALRFVGNKELVFKTPGQLDTQTLRGVRELTADSAELLRDVLKSARQQELELAALFPNELESGATYTEGARKQVVVNAFERDPKARKACIDHHGYDCAVCNFNFEARYGDRGKEFIHVHHLKPMALTDGEYKLNPVEDLRPVCPNCHVMLHRREAVMSIEELRQILKNDDT